MQARNHLGALTSVGANESLLTFITRSITIITIRTTTLLPPRRCLPAVSELTIAVADTDLDIESA
jgi:hypothetical protein